MNYSSSLVTGLGLGFYAHGFSALFKPIATELGLSRAATSTASAIRSLINGLMAPFVGWLVDRFGPRWIIVVGIIIMGTGLSRMNYINSIWSFYIVWGIIVALGRSLALTIAVDKSLTNWFVSKRGLAFAVRFTIISIVTTIVLPLISWLIETRGWRTTCFTWGGVMFACIPLMWFFIRQRRPEFYDLLPDGAATEHEYKADSGNMIDRGVEYAAGFHETEFTLRQAMKTPAFWMLILANSLMMLVQGGFALHCIPFITDMGISPTVAGGMMSMMIFFSIPSRFFCASLADHIRKDHLNFLITGAFLCQAVGITAFLFNQTITMVYVLLILNGIGLGPIRPMLILIRARYFGRQAYGSIEGVSAMLETPLPLLSPIYAGWIYDTTGSYISAFTVYAVLAFIAVFILCLVRPPKQPYKATVPKTSG
ncbi:MFS transporter [Thermodesulfobacteriota bacterium]